jgi:hypothetical protein
MVIETWRAALSVREDVSSHDQRSFPRSTRMKVLGGSDGR